MYQGATEQRPAGVSATLYPTTKLLDDAQYHNRNYILSEDNWFSSPEQQEYCLARGIHCNGTVKANRKNIPKQAIFKDTGAQKKARGEMQCMKCTRDGKDYYFTSWMDSKPVHMLHTYPTMYQPVNRKAVTPEGTFYRIQIQRPTVIADYNKGMGGTDLGDQRNSYYRFDHRTTQWPHRIYSQFIMVAITNAYILWKSQKQERANVRQLAFMVNLMHQLGQCEDRVENSDNESKEEPPMEVAKETSKRRSKTWIDDESRLCGHHTPAKVEDNYDRRLCKAGCQSKSSFYCIECQAFLCINGHGEGNCWWRFHNLKQF